MEMLQRQAQEIQAQVDEVELELEVMKEEYDTKSKTAKEELSVLKRVLKTINSATTALATEEDSE